MARLGISRLCQEPNTSKHPFGHVMPNMQRDAIANFNIALDPKNSLTNTVLVSIGKIETLCHRVRGSA